MVEKADRERTTPGEALHELLAKYSPPVILIDEWVAYARSLVGRDDLAGGTFDDQFTFAQSLTEAVKEPLEPCWLFRYQPPSQEMTATRSSPAMRKKSAERMASRR